MLLFGSLFADSLLMQVHNPVDIMAKSSGAAANKRADTNTTPSQHTRSTPETAASPQAAQHNEGRSMRRNNWQHPADSEAAGTNSTAALRSLQDLSVVPSKSASASRPPTAPVPSDASSPPAIDRAGLLNVRSTDAQAPGLDIAASASHDSQNKEASRKSKHLQRLEAAAARWQQRPSSGSSTSPGQSQSIDEHPTNNNFSVESKRYTSLPETQTWHPQQMDQGMELAQLAAGSANEEPAFETDATTLSARPNTDNTSWYTSDASLSVPPPPPTLTKKSGSKARASWWAALKGDAPPWLL